jgi:hypothetical protein
MMRLISTLLFKGLYSLNYELPFLRDVPTALYHMLLAHFQRLVLCNFRRSWYISTEDLVPTKEAYGAFVLLQIHETFDDIVYCTVHYCTN